MSSYPDSNVATLVETLADRHPDKVYCRQIEGANVRDAPLRDITWAQVRRAANRLSFWLDEVLRPSENLDPFFFYGVPDATYVLVVIAAAKTQRLV